MNAENKLKLFLLMQYGKETASEMWSSKGNKQWTVIEWTLLSDLWSVPLLHSHVEKLNKKRKFGINNFATSQTLFPF